MKKTATKKTPVSTKKKTTAKKAPKMAMQAAKRTATAKTVRQPRAI